METITYEPAATEQHPNKQGVNKITWRDGVMYSKEYCPVDPRTLPSPALAAWNAASDEEKKQMANDLKKFL